MREWFDERQTLFQPADARRFVTLMPIAGAIALIYVPRGNPRILLGPYYIVQLYSPIRACFRVLPRILTSVGNTSVPRSNPPTSQAMKHPLTSLRAPSLRLGQLQCRWDHQAASRRGHHVHLPVRGQRRRTAGL